MAASSTFQFLFLISIFISLSLVTVAVDSSSSTSGFPSPPQPSFLTSTTTTTSPPPPFSIVQDNNLKPPFSPFSSITPILTDVGYHDLAVAAHTLSLSSTTIPWLGPTTIFAPADSSVRTCPSCSLSLLLQEHTVPGLYPMDYLAKLVFGTKIETILPGRCLTVTYAINGTKIFVGGAEITRPDLFNNGHVIVHGLQGFVSHLSPYSCSIDKMTSLAMPHPSPIVALTRMMLADAMVRLRTSGFSVLALALRVKSHELVTLHNMTIFALDDSSIFHGGHSYVRDIRFHIVPNRLLKLADLESLPSSTVLPTLDIGETLTVTTTGGGGMLSPMRINYVRIKNPDLIYNLKIVIHGLSLPFPHLHQSMSAVSGRSGFNQDPTDNDFGSEDSLGNLGDTTQAAPSPVILSTVEMDDHHGL